MKFLRLILKIIIGLTFTFPLSAQDDALSVGLRVNMKTAIESFESRDSIFLEPQLASELTDNYCLRYSELSQDKFGLQEKAKNLLDYYSTSEGMEEILVAWKSQTDSLNTILSIGNVLSEHIFLPTGTYTIQPPEIKEPPQNEPTVSSSKSTAPPVDRRREKRNKSELPKDPNVAREDRSRNKISRERITDKTDKKIGIIEQQPNKALMQQTPLSKTHSPKEIESMRIAAIHEIQINVLPDTLASQKVMMLSLDTPNKYAKLLVNEPEMNDAVMYLDGKMIAPVKKIKKGILVHSKQTYAFEITSTGIKLCGDTITLAPREEKTVKCDQ